MAGRRGPPRRRLDQRDVRGLRDRVGCVQLLRDERDRLADRRGRPRLRDAGRRARRHRGDAVTTPRMITAVGDVRPIRPTLQPTNAETVTEEVVEGEAPGGRYLIRGVATPTRIPTPLNEGDLVTVMWRRGAPFIILDAKGRKG